MPDDERQLDRSLKRRFLVQGALVAAVCVAFVWFALRTREATIEADLTLSLQQQREAVLLEANAIRYRLEAETLSTFYLVTSLASYISLHPELSQEAYRRYAAEVFDAKPGLVNIAAAPGLVIRYIYPTEGNEAALGLDYAAHPTQREAALRVRETGKPVVAGPINLVQGGVAIVGRFPVYTEVGQEQEGDRSFWGIVSTPIYVDQLFRSAGLLDADLSLQVALRGKDGLGAEGEVFFGDASLFNGDAARLPVPLLDGAWELGARPKDGWIATAPNAALITYATLLVCGLFIAIALLLHFYVMKLEQGRAMEASVSKAKSRFLANMSHEIRTPLNGISGLAQLLRLSEQTPDQERLTNSIVSSANALCELLTDVLNLSKLESGRYATHVEETHFESCLEPILDLARIEAENKGLKFRYSGVPESLAFLWIDVTVARQILWNLLNNAMKFTPKGEVSLQIELISLSGGESGVRFVVADTGVGIARERQRAVFDDFVQEDNSTTRNYGGAGLGLAIVRRLVDQVGGAIRLESEKGQGSRFTVDLPVKLER